MHLVLGSPLNRAFLKGCMVLFLLFIGEQLFRTAQDLRRLGQRRTDGIWRLIAGGCVLALQVFFFFGNC